MKKRNIVTGGAIVSLFAFSLLFAGMYLFGHIDQLRSTLIRPNSEYLNFPNVMVCLLGICEAVVPLLLLMDKKNFKSRVRVLKIVLYGISALYAVGNLWIFRWLYEVISSGHLSFDFAAYQLKWFNMFNHTIWASRNAETLMLNYLSSVLWFNIARYIDTDKYETCVNVFLMMIVVFLMPIAFFAITRFRLIPAWWLKKSVTLFVSYCFMLAIMLYSATKRNYWGTYVCPIKKVDEFETEKEGK